MWLKYSDAPILNDEYWTRNQTLPREDGYRSEYQKPSGCWITDDSEDCWRRFCTSENFNLECLTHKHEVILDESNILFLRGVASLDLFSREYGVSHWWGPPGEPRKHRNWCIEWERVAERYDGIIITPYQWQRRLHHEYSWYYTWDCASGCIWNAAAIQQINLIEIDMEVAKPKKTAEAA